MSAATTARPLGLLERATGDLYAIPEPHRTPDVGRAEAGQLLGCDDDTLTRLVTLGLPAAGAPGAERFDARDIFNLGLHSGAGLAGQMFRLALRWMRGTDDALVTDRRTTVTLEAGCPGPVCSGPARIRAALPVGECYGGSTEDRVLSAPGAAGSIVVAGGIAAADAPGLRVTTTVRTTGEIVPVRAAGARDAMREFLGSDLRWIRMPDALGADVPLMRRRGVASCAAAALWVAALCRDAGVPATTRTGWVAGVDLHHAWVEITDDDGVVKVLDPILALFAGMVPGANPAFGDPARSVRTARLIPTVLAVGDPPAAHRCGDHDGPVRPAVTLAPRPLT